MRSSKFRFAWFFAASVNLVCASGGLLSIALKTYGLNSHISIPFMSILTLVSCAMAAFALMMATSAPPLTQETEQ